jgi:HAD superfamily hydrolase (TIGR01549 family)
MRPPNGRWVCLDVGETLVDETRVWSIWADVLGVPCLTFAACLGGMIARGRPHVEAFELVGAHDWAEHESAVQARYGGFAERDLYPDARRTIAALQDHGYRVAVVGNQPARRHAELAALGVAPDAMAMSEALGVEKPDPAFFLAVLKLLGEPEPHAVAYVGDRVDNDVRPALAAGLRAVWIRRGPWGLLQDDGGAAHLTIASLDEFATRVGEAFEG